MLQNVWMSQKNWFDCVFSLFKFYVPHGSCCNLQNGQLVCFHENHCRFIVFPWIHFYSSLLSFFNISGCMTAAIVCFCMNCGCKCLPVCTAWCCRGNQYPSVAEEIKGLASEDPVHRKLFVRGLSWETTSETLCAVSALLPACCLLWMPDASWMTWP